MIDTPIQKKCFGDHVINTCKVELYLLLYLNPISHSVKPWIIGEDLFWEIGESKKNSPKLAYQMN